MQVVFICEDHLIPAAL